ncbi:MAG: Mrp/NBP35 family ATP-binding protein [Bacteroidales bacterium]|jgi:ATP-binding protein involved in chromosome partitioning|nr:Mrp/NBP35 family ATP-binding protein [Bacteroidales bacterium]MCI1784822.1 Mrp/NBP35 family ATP-binding protein [Bacteroidales bacterium]
MKQNEIMKMLFDVQHPGKEDKNIVELGMVDKVEIDGNKVTVTLAFPKRRDPLAEYLEESSKAAIYRHAPEGTEVEIKTVIRNAGEHKQNGLDMDMAQLDNVSHIIGVASGKGGVGKSTIAVNLAVALARLGYKVGLADADVYGPSVPKMTGTEDQMPEAVKEGDKELILPIEKFGVEWMSIGFFAKQGEALIWRGPMACNALKQMILQVKWGVLDFLLIDMPPGTGDIHISLVQDIPMEGAVIVTTPQPVALADVEKSVNMFRNKNIEKTIFGLVENMSWFTPAELPENRYYIFGKNGGLEMAENFKIPLLGQIPIVQSIREDGDGGEPAALSSRPDGAAFVTLAENLVKAVNTAE